VLPAATVVLSLAAGWAGGTLASGDGTSSSSGVTASPARLVLAGDTLDVAGVIAAVEPSVVSVETTIRVRQGPFVSEGQGAGTGVVIDDAGHVLTNAHVVADASTITVTVAGEARDATLVAADTSADIAVLQLADTSGLVPADLASAGTTAVGDQVVAIGNALALEGGPTVTEGIVSALDRSIDTETGTLQGLIQTDAAISSGNSGGPLVNAAGQVIGINAAVATSSGSVNASNIGFAISIQDAMRVADRMIGAV
jgi:putative serine protease PepD